MKFSEIPKFKSWGNYQVNVFVDYLQDTLDRYSEQGLELNPDFQRGHVWIKEQQIKYVEFFLKGGSTGRDIFFNCSSWNGSYDTPIQCVDGLQRITALLAFLNNEIKVFGHYYNEYEDRLRLTDCSLIFHVNNLKTRKEVLEWYYELNAGGVVHSKYELERVKKLIEEESK